MKVVIITGTQPHMLYLCKKVIEKYNVVGVFHFDQQKNTLRTVTNRLKYLRRTIVDKGIWGSIVQLNNLRILYGKDRQKLLGYQHANHCFREYDVNSVYGSLKNNNIYRPADINSNDTINKIKNINPDVVICHGGPVYSAKFINGCKLILNYHSGISPLYNGTHSHLYAYSNGHPYLCGGTLMEMNEKVDGGNILSHFLPELKKNEKPAEIFSKCIAGSFKLYDSFLNNLENGFRYSKVTQNTPLFYYRGSDWSIEHHRKTQKNINERITDNFQRKEAIAEYWRSPSCHEAFEEMSKFVGRLIIRPKEVGYEKT